MRKISFIMLAALLLFGSGSAFAQKRSKKNQVPEPQPFGYISVKTTPESYPIFINGQDYGLTGSPESRQIEFNLTNPAETYDVEIRFPNKTYRKTMNVERGKNVCICLNYNKKVITRPCPYEVSLAAAPTVNDGDNIVFTADPKYKDNAPVNLNYRWTVFPEAAQIREGQGTSAITVDSTGLGGQTVTATLEVDTGYDDAACRQKIPFATDVKPLEVVKPTPAEFDVFDFVNNDALKARLDNFALQLQQQPDFKGHIIVYGKLGSKPAATDRLGIYALDYLTRNRKIDARRVMIVNGGTRANAAFELYLLPPGADPPMPK